MGFVLKVFILWNRGNETSEDSQILKGGPSKGFLWNFAGSQEGHVGSYCKIDSVGIEERGR